MSERENLILAINPGSTSTKVGLFSGANLLYDESFHHSREDLAQFSQLADQLDFRTAVVESFLQKHQVRVPDLVAVVSRGSILKPVQSGAYVINDAMLADLKSFKYGGDHVSRLGPQIAAILARPHQLPAYIVDPISVDEYASESRYSGLPELPRISLLHALNTRAIAYRYAADQGTTIDQLNVVIAHLGGGLSFTPLQNGKMIDNNNANENGPMSPERAGTLPSLQLAQLCYSGRYTQAEMTKRLIGGGGLMAHLGTNDLREALQMTDGGDEHAAEVLEAMFYQMAKEIGAMAVALKGECSAIILTGGMAHSERLVERIRDYVSWIAPVVCYPGEDELKALAEGAWRVLQGEEEAREY